MKMHSEQYTDQNYNVLPLITNDYKRELKKSLQSQAAKMKWFNVIKIILQA